MPETSIPAAGPAAPRTLAGAAAWILAGTICLVLFAQMILEDRQTAGAFASAPLWLEVVTALGGSLQRVDGQPLFATVPLIGIMAWVAGFTLTTWIVGAGIITVLSRRTWPQSASEWGSRGWKWWCLPGVWYFLSLVALITRLETLGSILIASVELWWAVALAGWLATFLGLLRMDASPSNPPLAIPGWGIVVAAIAIYTIVFTAMNWQLYECLLVPHGDSAMYEEHLWNITHGKGFRSYLDQGLFLGEHIQFIHLGLLPLYLLWPSHLLLELCESLALASTALPVYWIARRHTGSTRAAVWMATATLLYFPLQYLDIAIDLKTFRPISFGVPLLMLAIDQLERRHWKAMTALLLLTLTAKEDFAIVIAPLGMWLGLSAWWDHRSLTLAEDDHGDATLDRTSMIVGAAMTVLATVYLLLAVKVLIPWFREGETVHYARYFSQFGETPTQIVTNMLTHPGLLLGEFLTTGTLLYALRVLVPLGGTPLLSPSRLLVGAPLFLLLCLNELAQETPAPVHHFHAPLLPILFWSAAAGLPHASRLWNRLRRRAAGSPQLVILKVARFAGLCALTTGIVMSIHPLSRKFWDSGDARFWQRVYVPGERALRFAEVLKQIPVTSRVASTDFVHPRFTHFERSYDYSGYLRKVAGYEHRVPDDTDYIVIDTQHPYSTMHNPDDVPEFHDADSWELTPTGAEPWYIVLRRRTDATVESE